MEKKFKNLAKTYTDYWDVTQSEFILKDGIIKKFNGHWKNGEKDGEGVMIYVNKDIYSGQWKNGKKEGQGTYIFNDTGMKFVGTFKCGNLI